MCVLRILGFSHIAFKDFRFASAISTNKACIYFPFEYTERIFYMNALKVGITIEKIIIRRRPQG
jgi:hypothetical protein